MASDASAQVKRSTSSSMLARVRRLRSRTSASVPRSSPRRSGPRSPGRRCRRRPLAVRAAQPDLPVGRRRPPPTRRGRRASSRSRGRREGPPLLDGRRPRERGPAVRRSRRPRWRGRTAEPRGGRNWQLSELAHLVPGGLDGVCALHRSRGEDLSVTRRISDESQSLGCGYSSRRPDVMTSLHRGSRPARARHRAADRAGDRRRPQAPALGRQLGDGVRGFKDSITSRTTPSGTTTADAKAQPALDRPTARGGAGRRRGDARALRGRRGPLCRSAMATRLKPIGHEDRLSIVEHLDELRTRVIICVIVFVVAFGVCLWQEDFILARSTIRSPRWPTRSRATRRATRSSRPNACGRRRSA